MPDTPPSSPNPRQKKAHQRVERARSRSRSRRPGRPSGTRREQTPFGPVTVSSGRGNQPKVTSREPDYAVDGQPRPRVGLDYPALLAGLDHNDEAALHSALKGGSPQPPRDALKKRKLAMLTGIVKYAEAERDGAAEKLMRAALRRKQREKRRAKKLKLSEMNPMMKPGKAKGPSGARAWRAAHYTEQQLLTVEAMSASSGSESDVEASDSESGTVHAMPARPAMGRIATAANGHGQQLMRSARLNPAIPHMDSGDISDDESDDHTGQPSAAQRSSRGNARSRIAADASRNSSLALRRMIRRKGAKSHQRKTTGD